MNHEQRAFKRILWGLVFLIDIRMWGVLDILPDVFGMLLVLKSLTELQQTAPSFYRAKRFMPVVIVLTGYELIGPFFGGLMGEQLWLWSAIVQSIAILATNIYLIWLLTSGVREWANSKSLSKLADTAKRRGLFYGAVNLFGTVIMLAFSIVSPSIFTALGQPMSFMYVIITVMVIALFKQAAAIAAEK
ncbi:hypothetical protein NQ117_06120 [Paenibacillus sp. SC116]|uniref:hypothetical protein n=1 Tax=Paenibacillus sp. SC116 TaxID=2968986 RepID=UPI00215B018D|nr:hypothetical protein [Paenibacillus sp. SC116]MCR8843252.1 hypothetical protein [Paenibacillus sp. SC116]